MKSPGNPTLQQRETSLTTRRMDWLVARMMVESMPTMPGSGIEFLLRKSDHYAKEITRSNIMCFEMITLQSRIYPNFAVVRR